MKNVTFKASVMVLTMATLLVTARQYIGDPIACMVEVNMGIYYVRVMVELCLHE